MNYLSGKRIKISITEMKKFLGKEVRYLLNCDIDGHRNTHYCSRRGVLEEVKDIFNICISGVWITKREIAEIVLVED